MNNDLALVKLSNTVNCNKRIQAACLTKEEPQHGTQCTVSGWGILKQGTRKQPKILMKVDVPIVAITQCVAWYLEAGETITEPGNVICAGFKKGKKDSCQNDSGGNFKN